MATSQARTANTEKDYLRRFRQQKQRLKKILGRDFTFKEFVADLIENVRPTLSASSWRQYRSAAIFGLEQVALKHPQFRAAIKAAITNLRAAAPAQRETERLRTSQKKAKSLPDDDLEKVKQIVRAGQSANGQKLCDLLTAGALTGLRPCEWPSAVLRPCAAAGFEWELTATCAKNTHGRAHGESRTLRFVALDAETVKIVSNWIAIADEAERKGTYRRLLNTLGSLMYRSAVKIFPRRKKRPTIYTARHIAAARWKAYYVNGAATPEARELGRAMVAALLGHATDETASQHYARPGRGGKGSGRFPVPAADPAEIAHVRRRFAIKWAAKARVRKIDPAFQP